MEPLGGDEKPQLPGPSLWPVGFAVGITCILVGLVVSWPAVAVGAAITAIFGFLWIRDATRGYREVPALEPETRATATAPAIPAHEGEAAMPEPEPGERFPRSVFLEGATLGLGAVIGGIVTAPAIGFALLPAFTDDAADEIDLGPIENFGEGEFVVATFLANPKAGEVSRRTAYVRNNGMVRGKPSFTVLSNRCVHLGCPVQPNGPLFEERKKLQETRVGEVQLIPTLPAGGFGCPCHGGSYDAEGNRTAGPPVRALDRYDFAIRNGRLMLRDTYSVAYVQETGAGARIKRYGQADPGVHLDGPQSWLYPIQAPEY